MKRAAFDVHSDLEPHGPIPDHMAESQRYESDRASGGVNMGEDIRNWRTCPLCGGRLIRLTFARWCEGCHNYWPYRQRRAGGR